jgi:hypothetical protein
LLEELYPMRPLANGEPVEAEGAAGGCTSAILGDPSLLSSPLDRGCGETETAVQFVDAVNFARERGLLLSVKGGGHNVAGNAVNDGGLVIDLSQMRGVHVDPSTQTVRAEGGATWGEADLESQLFGLAVPGGVSRPRASPA